MEPEKVVVEVLERLLEQRDEDVPEVALDSRLQDDLRLDSLEIAELSAALEERLGRDPYNEGLAPRTVAELIAFYTP